MSDVNVRKNHSSRPSHLYPHGFPNNRRLIPGIAFASKLPPTAYRPVYIPNPYDFGKSLEGSNIESSQQDTVRVNAKPEVNQQMGFGSVKVNEDQEIDNNDIDFKSAEKVDPQILNAFENPVVRVQTSSFVPKSDNNNEVQKYIAERVRNAINKKTASVKQKINKLKLV